MCNRAAKCCTLVLEHALRAADIQSTACSDRSVPVYLPRLCILLWNDLLLEVGKDLFSLLCGCLQHVVIEKADVPASRTTGHWMRISSDIGQCMPRDHVPRQLVDTAVPERQVPWMWSHVSRAQLAGFLISLRSNFTTADRTAVLLTVDPALRC